MEGKSEQATRSGKNKFDLSKIRNAPSVFNVTKTGVNLTNCWVGDVYTQEDVLKTFKPNTTYTMRVKAKVVSRPSTIISEQLALFLLYRPDTSSLGSVWKDALLMQDKETIALNTEKEYITTFTTPADMTDVRFLAYCFYGNNDGSNTDVGSGEIDVSEIMLVEGTYTAENFPDFELYGASPSPEFPSEVKHVEGWNKLDLSKCTFVSCSLNSDGKSFTSNINNNYFCSIKTTELNEFLLNRKGKEITFSTGKGISNRFVSIVIKGVRQSGAAYQEMHSEISGSKVTIKIAEDFTSISELELRFNRSGATFSDTTTTIPFAQLVEGSEEKPYAPFNSLVIEDVGENEFNKNTEVYRFSNCTYTYENGIYTITNTNTKNPALFLKLNLKPGTYTLNSDVYLSTATQIRNVQETVLKNFASQYKAQVFTINEESAYITFNWNTTTKTITLDLNSLMILKSEYTEETMPDYEPYKSQTEYFPLAENQKLMQGSYISDTGIHHRRKQIVLDGTENWINFNERTNTVRAEIIITDMINIGNKIGLNLICSHFKPDDIYNRDAVGIEQVFNRLFIRINKSELSEVSLEGFKAYLAEQYANGTPVVLEYELAEEVIEPFTTEQQTAWNNIKAIKLFERSKQYYFKCNIES